MNCAYCVTVAVSGVSYHFDSEFSYLLPDSLVDKVSRGIRVEVPFGNGNRKRPALVFDVAPYKPTEDAKALKSVSSVLDDEPLFGEHELALVRFLKEYTFCTLYEAAKCMLPAGIDLKEQQSYIALNQPESASKDTLDETEREILEYLLNKGKYVNRDTLLKALSLVSDHPAPENLVSLGLVGKNTELIRKTGDFSVRNVRLLCDESFFENDFSKLSVKQKSVMSLLRDIGSASVKEVCYFTGVTQAVVSGLQKRGLIELYDCEVMRRPKVADFSKSSCEPKKLEGQQVSAYNYLGELLDGDKPGAALLYGITGSGKTQVYLSLVDRALADNKGVIVMVPEIALTPQALEIFYSRYGEKVAVFHSALSAGERLDEWKRVKNGEAVIALGTRSAVFAPVKNLGLIVMDEEQEHTYKSEMSPKYHAREVAKYRCVLNNALLLLCSATPSIESYYNAAIGKYGFVSLEERYGNAVLPEVTTVDLSETKGSVSNVLYDKIEERLSRHEQAILLINRRGYNTFASCKKCKKVVVCPNCSISLTYHKQNNRLMCHYCGYSKPYTEKCEYCSENGIRYAGTGTQKLEDELALAFPEARILRMDADTTVSRYSYEEKLSSFARGEFDILIGTQMVAKGLDFPDVTLVGVISVDRELYSDDFRSSETTFDLLTQVVGRSGRREIKGEAVIQSVLPDNDIITLASKQDYPSFYDTEIAIRKAMVYPPFCDICTVSVVSSSERLALHGANVFLELLKEAVCGEYKDVAVNVLGPVLPRVGKINNKYRYKLTIKCKNSKSFREMMSKLICSYKKNSQLSQTYISADMNALN